MPYQIKWNEDYVLFEYFGNVSSRELVESNEQVYGDPRFDTLRWELVYFDQAESVSMDERTIRLIAYMDQAAARSNPNITVAFVGKSEILQKIEELYQKTDSNPIWPLLRFDSCDEAIAYINQVET